MSDQTVAPQLPTPDPALRRLDRLIGTWDMEGHLVGSDETAIKGQASFRWLAGGFFMEQRFHMNFLGMELESVELIGYDPETRTFPSTVYANIAPTPLPYRWEVDEDTLKISVSYGPMDATFTGRFDEDGNAFRGGWRPNPGADESMNVPYDIIGRRVA